MKEYGARAALEHLLECGIIEARGNERSRSYIFSESVYKAHNMTEEYSRQTASETLHQEKIIQDFVVQNGSISRNEARKILNITSPQAYRILKKMADKSLLSLEGKGRSSFYKANTGT